MIFGCEYVIFDSVWIVYKYDGSYCVEINKLIISKLI